MKAALSLTGQAAILLHRSFFAVQVLLVAVMCSAWPEVMPIMIPAGLILILTFVALEVVRGRRGEEATLGWLVFACQSLWVPTMLAYRAGWLTNFTCSLPVLFFGCGNWAHFIFYMRLMRIPMKPRIATGGVCGLAFFLHPAVTTIGQPAEGLLVFCSLLSGELFGYAFEARTAAGKLELEQRSQQLINHAAKRVASNAAQSCMLVLAKLEEIDSDDPAQRARARSEAEDLLRACWAGSVQGFHACKAALLHKSLKKKEYWSQKNESLDTFTPDALLSALGIDRDRRFAPQVPPGCPAVRADRTLLEAILFNATQNAALHGAAQHPIAVRCSVDEAGATSTLTVEIENAAGPNHSKLLNHCFAVGVDDLFEADERRDLRSAGVGNRESTFLGLSDMKLAAGALHPPATLRLRVLPAQVRFELTCPVTIAAAAPPDADADAPDPAAAFGTLEGGVARRASHERTSNTSSASAYTEPARPTEGLTFVVADDDDIARVVASQLIERCGGDRARSIVVGESRDEVAALPARVAALGREIGEASLVCIFDQNMNYPDGDVLGTDLCRELRAAGWRGVLLIQSANDSAADAAFYREAGADGTLGKSVSSVADTVAYLEELLRARTVTVGPS